VGYAFVPSFKKGVKGEFQMVASRKSWKRLKETMGILVVLWVAIEHELVYFQDPVSR